MSIDFHASRMAIDAHFADQKRQRAQAQIIETQRSYYAQLLPSVGRPCTPSTPCGGCGASEVRAHDGVLLCSYCRRVRA